MSWLNLQITKEDTKTKAAHQEHICQNMKMAKAFIEVCTDGSSPVGIKAWISLAGIQGDISLWLSLPLAYCCTATAGVLIHSSLGLYLHLMFNATVVEVAIWMVTILLRIILEFDKRRGYCSKEAMALSLHHPLPCVLKYRRFRESCMHSLALALSENEWALFTLCMHQSIDLKAYLKVCECTPWDKVRCWGVCVCFISNNHWSTTFVTCNYPIEDLIQSWC